MSEHPFRYDMLKTKDRKKLIAEFEFLRQGFRSILDFCELDAVNRAAIEAYHTNADRNVVELGGESVYTRNKS